MGAPYAFSVVLYGNNYKYYIIPLYSDFLFSFSSTTDYIYEKLYF